MGRFARSWALARESYAVLRQNPHLMIFPVLSSIISLVISISFFVPMYMITGGKDLDRIRPAVGYPIAFGFYFVTYFVVIFFNSAMVACAYHGLMGRPTTMSDGLSAATQRLGAILGWTAIAATVGMVLKFISERTGIIGRIVIGLVGFAWNLATYFVVPVMVIEHGSPIGAVKKSTAMLRQTWGEQLMADAGIGLAMSVVILFGVLLLIPAIFLMASGALVLGIVLMAIAVLYIIAAATVSAAMQGIYQTALYVYANTGTVPRGFSPATIQMAFVTKENAVSKLRRRF